MTKHANDNQLDKVVKPLTFISMFSGIEAASVAFGPLGWRALRFAEIEKFPSAVLAHHYPDVPNVGDMTQHDWAQYRGLVDIACGGPPCQAFSLAGLRLSMQDARGNLSLAYMRAIHAIRPKNAITENVPGWLSTADNAFGCFLAGLVGADDPLHCPGGGKWPDAGMVAGPLGRAAWRVLDAQHFGLAQRRRRVVVVSDFGDGADPAAVLFERKSMSGYSPARRKAGEGVAPTISARTKGGGGLGADFDLDGGLINYAPEIARCVATREGSSQDYESTTMVAVSVSGDIAHTLKADGHDASEGGTGRGAPIIAFSAKDYGGDASNDIAPTLRAGGASGSHANAGVMPAIAFGWQNSASQGLSDSADVTPTLDKSKTPAIAFNMHKSSNEASSLGVSEERTDCLRSFEKSPFAVMPPQSAVRRLTPGECESLQGFPRGYTMIPWRGKPAEECPDGPRYKAIGNSWAVPKFAWVGKRIARLLAEKENA